MKNFLFIIVSLIFLLTACSGESEKNKTKKETSENTPTEQEVVGDTLFDYDALQKVEVALNNNVKAHYQHMIDNPTDTIWEEFYPNYTSAYEPLIDEFKENKLNQEIIDSMVLVNESAKLVDSFYNKKKNEESTDEVKDQIEEKFTEIHSKLETAYENGKIEPTDELTNEMKNLYQTFLDHSTNKNFEAYADMFWDDRKELVVQAAKDSMEGYTIEYNLHDVKIIEAYEDAIVIQVVQDNLFVDIEEGFEANDSKTTANVYFVKKDDQWKVYKDELINSETIQ